MGGGLTTSALSLFYFMGHKIIHFFVTTKQIYQFVNLLIISEQCNLRKLISYSSNTILYF